VFYKLSENVYFVGERTYSEKVKKIWKKFPNCVPCILNIWHSCMGSHLYATTLKPSSFYFTKEMCTLNNDFCWVYNVHSKPIFYKLKIVKLPDLVTLQTALLMYEFHTKNPPVSLQSFFTPVNERHAYHTRLVSRSSLSLPKDKANYGKKTQFLLLCLFSTRIRKFIILIFCWKAFHLG